MNHLAHLLLAEATPESRLGNLAADYVWQFAVMILVCGQVSKSAEGDIKKLFDDYYRRQSMN